jgi:hypothetical protein
MFARLASSAPRTLALLPRLPARRMSAPPPAASPAAAAAASLKRKMAAPAAAAAAPRVGTHSGTFHADEALGCFLLRQTARFAGAEIVRSRDPAVLEPLDAVIDVGGVYDPGALRVCWFVYHLILFNNLSLNIAAIPQL